MYQLGGSVVHLTTGDSQLGRAEPIEDSAKVISRMVDLVMIRTFEQTKIERFAAHSRVPVINGLTNEFHPCQILADIFTFIEHRGSIQGKTVAWVGDGNNMANTWLQASEILGFKVHVSTSPTATRSTSRSRRHPLQRQLPGVQEPAAGLPLGADLVTTDVWTSMGFEAENEARRKAFADWCVDRRDDGGGQSRRRCSCTACRRTAARRSRPMSSTDRSRSSGTRPRTACTCNKALMEPVSHHLMHR
jgi:ornithine carbamoyltransferase